MTYHFDLCQVVDKFPDPFSHGVFVFVQLGCKDIHSWITVKEKESGQEPYDALVFNGLDCGINQVPKKCCLFGTAAKMGSELTLVAAIAGKKRA